jgi:ketosteroid isomerase-like protein
MFDRLRVEPQRFVEVGDRVIVVFRATGRGRESGIPIDVTLANVFTMRGGRIVEWRSYTGPEQALESVGLGT